jgi:hypothetical protein
MKIRSDKKERSCDDACVITIDSIPINPVHDIQQLPSSGECCQLTKVAIGILKAISLLFIVAGACIIAISPIPAVALLVIGAAALILRVALPKLQEVCHSINANALPAMPLGREAWIKHIGDPGKEPPLSPNIEDILASPCPFWPGKTVRETHLLVLIPETIDKIVDGEREIIPLTLENLDKLIKSTEESEGVGYEFIPDLVIEESEYWPVENSHWVLMTKHILPGSENMSYDNQKQMVESAGYVVPNILEAATAILLQYVCSKLRYFSDDPWTYTRCAEEIYCTPLIIGGFTKNGLLININDFDDKHFGIAGLLKL